MLEQILESKRLSRRDFGNLVILSVLGKALGCTTESNQGNTYVPYYQPSVFTSPTPIPTPRPIQGIVSGSFDDCLRIISEQRIRQIGKQGGYLNPGSTSYIVYNGEKISYLCYNIHGQENCRNRILTISDMEQDLSNAIKGDLQNQCSAGNLDVEVNIELDETFVRASSNSLNASKSFPFPLGRLFEVVHDIKNNEAVTGSFDTLSYALEQTQITNLPYMIQKLQPYPDKLYICKIKDVPSPNNEFIFQFAIEGEPR